MANAKNISFVDAVQKQAREDLVATVRVMLEPLREVIGILDRRTNDLNERVKRLEEYLKPVQINGGVPTPEPPDAT